MKNAIVLAAGQGTRMLSQRSKAMHQLLGKPMIELVISSLEKSGVDNIVVVVPNQEDPIVNLLGDRVSYAIQEEPLGTINGVSKVTQLASLEGDTLILHGDCGLIQVETIQSLFEKHENSDLSIITAKPVDAGKSRRVVRDNQGEIEKIVEFDSLDELNKNTREITMGVYCVNNALLYKYLPALADEASTGANIMGLVEVMKRKGHLVQGIYLTDYRDLLGINDRTQLVEANKWLQNKINNMWLSNGVTIIDPNSTYIGPDVVLNGDNIVYPNNHLYGKVSIGKNTVLYPNNWIENAEIGDDCSIDSSRITDSYVGGGTTVGPFAHLRMHTNIQGNARIGNFVEFKNVEFGDNSKSAHLTYLGDATFGNNVNVGCGVITANYDGNKKHRTVVGDDTFIGSHTTLIAPVNIGENVLTAAGSVINQDIESGAMGIARSRQVNKQGFGNKFKNKG